MAGIVAEAGLRLRPHAKTHKSPEIALEQMARGAVGACCQKVSEAEILVRGGVDDVLVSNEVVGRRKLDRLAALAREARVAVCVDDRQNVDDVAAAAARMDVRLDVLRILGLRAGEAHIIRNAGGIVTDDVIRSLCLSQRLLGTREVILVHHTGCGLQMLDEHRFLAELEAEVGIRPSWALDAFADPYEDVVESMRRLRSSPFLLYKSHMRGFVYDVADGNLHEAQASNRAS